MSRLPQPLQRQHHDQVAESSHTAQIGVVGDELAAAVLAQIALLPVGGPAILFDDPRGTARASDFFVADTLKDSLSEPARHLSINSGTRLVPSSANSYGLKTAD